MAQRFGSGVEERYLLASKAAMIEKDAKREATMLDLLEQQTSLTTNQWKIFAASIFS
jgi:hypothetical protein